MAAVSLLHAHVWQLMELDFGTGGAVRRFECSCGAIDFDAVAGASG
jgi:hypothetical protein